MKKVLLVFVVLLLVCAGGVGLFVKLRSQPAMEKKTIANVQAAGSLKEHTKHFERKVYKVADNIYSAVGFGLANSIMIEGDDGLIIVDTMESLQEAREVLAEFRKISDKPIKAIIYTPQPHRPHFRRPGLCGGRRAGGLRSRKPGLLRESSCQQDEAHHR